MQQFDIVAIQEISTKNEYLIPNFVKLINQSGRKYDHVIGRRLGNTKSKEQYAYIFNTRRVMIDHQSVYTISDPDNLLHREPLVATFQAREIDPDEAFTFTLVVTHTDPDVVPQELDALAEVYRVVRRSSRGEDDIILLGDFNTDDRHLGRLGQLPGILPLIAGVSTNTRQSKQYDNIVIHQPSTTEYTGRSGVFDVMRRYKPLARAGSKSLRSLSSLGRVQCLRARLRGAHCQSPAHYWALINPCYEAAQIRLRIVDQAASFGYRR